LSYIDNNKLRLFSWIFVGFPQVVLLTRLESDELLHDIFDRHDHLCHFMSLLVASKHDVFVRFACCVASRFKLQMDWNQLGQQLMELLAHRTQAPLADVDIWLLSALEHWLEALRLSKSIQVEQAVEIMDLIWKRFDRIIIYKKTLHRTQETITTEDWQLMVLTLETLLPSESDLEIQFERTVNKIWLRNGPWICEHEGIVQWYLPLLQFGSSDHPFRRDWHETIFLCTLATNLAKKKNHETINIIWSLIMAHIGSNSNEHASRVLAWATAAHVVETSGWMLDEGANRHVPVGANKQMCTLTRLASGEWRIQLGRACFEEVEESPCLIHCGRVVMAAFHALLVSDATTLSPDGLLHLRHSFQDVHHSTVSFLSIVKKGTETTARVLGCMLTEFSVWDCLYEDLTTDDVLQATGLALETHVPEMLMCMVSIMDSADEKDGTMNSLIKSGILGDPLIGCLTHFWTTAEPHDWNGISWACQTSDLLYSISAPPTIISLKLAKLVLRWIRSAVGNDASTNETFTMALSSAVGSYVVLMGDSIPSDQDSSIIKQALKICAERTSISQI